MYLITFISALVLFCEMLLIRWVGTEIRVFAYLQNGILVAVFLGLGVGCRNARQPVKLLPAMVALCSIALVIWDPMRWEICEGLTQGLSLFEDSVIWFQISRVSLAQLPYLRFVMISFSLAGTLILLLAIAYVFYPLGQWLARWMDASPRPIAAYSANILGSILGIALFDVATVAQTPPWVWAAATSIGMVVLALRSKEPRIARGLAVLLALSLPVLAWVSTDSQAHWSPYQKLSLETMTQRCGRLVQVNNSAYQLMLDVDPVQQAKKGFAKADIHRSHYHLPYSLLRKRKRPGRVLVVGSGAGNDVAAALQAGARAVDAVEIDPTIVSLGREHHPNKPYQSPRVTVTIDDARAFFRQDAGRYDVIWFGLLDSHTTPSAYTNVRLDHFVYTRESLADMKRHLAPGGVVVMFFAPEAHWIGDRLAVLLKDAFGALPLTLLSRSRSPCLGWGGMLYIAGSAQVVAELRKLAMDDPEIRPTVVTDPKFWPLTTEPTTDDWPYLYLKSPGVPKYHLLVGIACLILGLVLRRRLFRKGEAINPPMMLLGAGFMLLEVSGVSRAAMLFGTTWTVNAYVVGAVLTMILLANLTASRFKLEPTRWPALGLIISLVLLAVLPPAWIASLSLPLRVLAGGVFLALPVYFSGLIFIALWAKEERKDLALGSNILGSLLGGIGSMLSMLVGFSALIFIALAAYLAVLLLLVRSKAVSNE